MLPADRRMRRSEEFRRAVRGGRRAGSRMIVVHVLDAPSASHADGSSTRMQKTAGPTDPARIGFVVGRGVGGSVVRSQVSRRLRHVVRERLGAVPDGSLVVVRALGPSAGASSAALAADVDKAFDRLDLRGTR